MQSSASYTEDRSGTMPIEKECVWRRPLKGRTFSDMFSGKYEKKKTLSELACPFLFSSHSRAECWTHRERKQRKGGRRKAGQRLQSAPCICAGGERRWLTAKKQRDSPIRTFTGILRGVAFVWDLSSRVSHCKDLSQIKYLNTRKDVLAS